MNEEIKEPVFKKFYPMKNRKKLSYLLALLAASLGLSSLGNPILSLSVLAVLFVFVTAKARAVYPVVVTLALTVALVFVSTFISDGREIFFSDSVLPKVLQNRFGLGCAFLSAVGGTVSLAGLLKTGRDGWVAALVPPIGFAVGVLTGTAVEALPALAILPAGVLLSLKVGKGQKRTEAVAAVTFGLAVFLVAVLGGCAYATFGRINRQDLLSAVAGGRNAFAELLITVRDRYFEFLDASAVSESLSQTAAALREQFPDSVLSSLSEAVFNILPGLAILVCGVIAYAAQLLFQAVSIADGRGEMFPVQSRVFWMGLPSGVIYLVAFFVSFFASSANLFVAVCDNLILIFLPAFLAVGLQMVFVRFFRSKSKAKGVWVLLFAVCFCCMFGTFLYVVAFIGALESVLTPIRKKMADTLRNDRGPDQKA